MSKNYLSLFTKDEKNIIAANVQPKLKVLSQSPSLNWALDVFHGYTVCIYGPEGSGKSLLSMMYVGSMMQADPDACAVLITTEMRAPSPERLKQLGVDPDRLLIRQANTLNDVFDWISSMDEKFTNSDGTKGGPGLKFALENGFNCKALIIDSIKGIQGPKEQAADSYGKDIMGDMSKYLNAALRGVLPVIRDYDLMTIFVQQVSMNMNPDEVKYQNKKWVVPSGQALKHFCESMALVERVESKDSKLFDDSMHSIRDLPVQVGHTVRVRVEKQNLGNPFRDAQFRVNYGKGIVDIGLEIATLAASLGVVKHPINPESGKEIVAQWIFKDRKWIGFANFVKECEDSPELQRDLMAAVEKFGQKEDGESVVVDKDPSEVTTLKKKK